jgi:pimeloyl-ACP methyl ester carboxylesterase
MFVTVGDAQLYAVAFGSSKAPAILGIGGWIGSWELWADPFSLLSARWRTLAFDHRGAGVTQAPVGSITFATLVDDVFAILDLFGVEHAILAAESAGAAIALGAALQRPERITGLVIVDGHYFQETPLADDRFYTALLSSYPEALDWFVDACVPEPDCEAIKQWGRQILDRAEPQAAQALYRMAHSVDLRPEIKRITQPALILHGELDRIEPLDSARFLAEQIPGATLEILPGAGHVPTMTRPRAVAEAIERFFGRPVESSEPLP